MIKVEIVNTGGSQLGDDCSKIDCGRDLICGPDANHKGDICFTPGIKILLVLLLKSNASIKASEQQLLV